VRQKKTAIQDNRNAHNADSLLEPKHLRRFADSSSYLERFSDIPSPKL